MFLLSFGWSKNHQLKIVVFRYICRRKLIGFNRDHKIIPL